MGNISSQIGYPKYKNSSPESIQYPHSFPRTQARYQQNQLKVLPERTPDIRLRHTENGEILQTGGTLTGRQIQAKFGDNRGLKKCGSEPHLNKCVDSHHSNQFELDRERKFKKKYRAPPPPDGGKFSENSWDSRSKPRLFKTKIQSERKKSVPNYPKSMEREEDTPAMKQIPAGSFHRLSLPSLITPPGDFRGELQEATRRLRKIRADENNDLSQSQDDDGFDEEINKNKIHTLDHHMDKRDLIKLKAGVYDQAKAMKNDGEMSFVRSEASGKESSIEETFSKLSPMKKEAPKQFYFGMQSQQQNLLDNDTIPPPKHYEDSESSVEFKQNGYDSDVDFNLRQRAQEFARFSSMLKWKQRSSSVESVVNPAAKGLKYSSEEAEEMPRIFSIFPMRSDSNDRSRSGDSGISGDGSPAVYDDPSEPLMGSAPTRFKPLIPGWTPQQDLGDDSSFEEESFSAEELPDSFDNDSNQRHVFSLSLPRDHHLASYSNNTEETNQHETNFEKIRRSVSGILNTMNRKEAESTPENERGNWFLNKSCSALNSISKTTDELEDFAARNAKINSGRLMYLPRAEKPMRPRRYETRIRQKIVRDNEKLEKRLMLKKNEENALVCSTPMPESLQDSPLMNDRKTAKKKSKRFTFQSTIRQIERRRIAEKLSREAEKKEQQRLREQEIMQKVEKEFQKKRAREKVNIKQQLSRYSHENSNYHSSDFKEEEEEEAVANELQARSEPDGAVSSSPTSSLSQIGRKKENTRKYEKNTTRYSNNEYKTDNNSDDNNRLKPVLQTQVLSEYHQPQREYRDYHSSNKKHLLEAIDLPKQTTVHPKVIYKMPKTKAGPRYGSNNYRKDFAYGIKTKSEQSSWDQQSSQTKSSPNKYYSQFGPLTRL